VLPRSPVNWPLSWDWRPRVYPALGRYPLGRLRPHAPLRAPLPVSSAETDHRNLLQLRALASTQSQTRLQAVDDRVQSDRSEGPQREALVGPQSMDSRAQGPPGAPWRFAALRRYIASLRRPDLPLVLAPTRVVYPPDCDRKSDARALSSHQLSLRSSSGLGTVPPATQRLAVTGQPSRASDFRPCILSSPQRAVLATCPAARVERATRGPPREDSRSLSCVDVGPSLLAHSLSRGARTIRTAQSFLLDALAGGGILRARAVERRLTWPRQAPAPIVARTSCWRFVLLSLSLSCRAGTVRHSQATAGASVTTRVGGTS